MNALVVPEEVFDVWLPSFCLVNHDMGRYWEEMENDHVTTKQPDVELSRWSLSGQSSATPSSMVQHSAAVDRKWLVS